MTTPTAYPVKKQPLCADCKTHPASIKRGKENVCPDCYNEQPLPPLSQWDRVINPAYILSMESSLISVIAAVARLEKEVARLTATVDATITDN